VGIEASRGVTVDDVGRATAVDLELLVPESGIKESKIRRMGKADFPFRVVIRWQDRDSAPLTHPRQ
jgi:hypothetical protein